MDNIALFSIALKLISICCHRNEIFLLNAVTHFSIVSYLWSPFSTFDLFNNIEAWIVLLICESVRFESVCLCAIFWGAFFPFPSHFTLFLLRALGSAPWLMAQGCHLWPRVFVTEWGDGGGQVRWNCLCEVPWCRFSSPAPGGEIRVNQC